MSINGREPAIAVVLARIPPDHYAAVGYTAVMRESSPAWRELLTDAIIVWGLVDPAVLLFDSRKRAVHDFIAGTVVMRLTPPA